MTGGLKCPIDLGEQGTCRVLTQAAPTIVPE
jgi:hypothetical protein